MERNPCVHGQRRTVDILEMQEVWREAAIKDGERCQLGLDVAGIDPEADAVVVARRRIGCQRLPAHPVVIQL